MKDLLILLFISILLAYCSQNHIGTLRIMPGRYIDLPVVIMTVMLVLFCGLRTAFNDTTTYIRGFQNAPTLADFWASKPELVENPLYYWFQSFFRHHISDNYHLFLMVIACFTIPSFIQFIRRYSDHFVFSMVLFFTIGLYLSNLAAMKQSIAMAILTYALPWLWRQKYGRFYLIVFLASLFHSYAIMFLILPLFLNRPWTPITYATILAVVVVLFTFESSISTFLDYAEEIGKDINETEVFDTAGINIFRLSVFSVPLLISFAFQNLLRQQYSQSSCVMMNMSILSFLVMCLGLFSAANLFGRSAIYFEIGTVLILPWLVNRLFEPKSARFVFFCASVCYLLYFLYDTQNFVREYRSISFITFIHTLL